MTDERGVAYGFSTSSDGRWTAYYGANATSGKAEDKVDAMIDVWDWINSQSKRKGVTQQVASSPIPVDRGVGAEVRWTVV